SDLGPVCQVGFEVDGAGRAMWDFDVPVGMGAQVRLRLLLSLADAANEGCLRVSRLGGVPDALAADREVRIILRPDLEWRSNHQVSKAYLGPEHAFPAAVTAHPDGFDFVPESPVGLHLRASRGEFLREPEWTYGVPLPVDAERGMEAATDLFSPGYLAFALAEGEEAAIAFRVGKRAPAPPEEGAAPPAEPATLAAVLRRSLASFVVRRDDSRTIIAGYPWFLDWGRDT
ncbi:MAG: glycogen debranching protein, partial [Victivallales bacterium]|nr:glycogen debranching protein [Victivallales bacterium]